MTQVFISYRRDDAADAAGRIHDRLVTQYGAKQLFMDVDTIPPGLDFRGVIDEAVGKCQIFLAVIGPSWLTVTEQTGSPRLSNPADFVRLEIEAALKRGIPVIPVLVSGANIPRPDQLPESLQSLAFRNAINVRRNPDFHFDVDRLISWMEQLRYAAKNEAEKKREAAEKAYAEGERLRLGIGGVSIDYPAAAKRYREAAELGHAASQFTLGWLYRNGWGVRKSLTQAFQWYEKAAAQNHADAQRNMGLAYRYGWGVAVDLTESLRWYRLAAEHNHAAAQYNIAVVYQEGLGVPKDPCEGRRWLELSAANGHQKALEAIEREEKPCPRPKVTRKRA